MPLAPPNDRMPTVGSVMTSPPLSIEIEATVRAAEDAMTDREVRHLLVLDAGELVGVVSDRDLAVSSNAPDPDLMTRMRVRDVCSLDVYAVGPDEPLDDVLAEMAERRLGSAVVVDHGKLAGIFTATDACRCFAEHLRGCARG